MFKIFVELNVNKYYWIFVDLKIETLHFIWQLFIMLESIIKYKRENILKIQKKNGTCNVCINKCILKYEIN